MKKKIFYAYHRAGYDLLDALKNKQIASSYEEAFTNLELDYRNMNPSRGYIPDTEIFIYKIKVEGGVVTVNDGDYELETEEKNEIINMI